MIPARGRRAFLFAIVVWLSTPSVAGAAQPGGFEVLDRWHQAQRVTDVAQSADGYLWAGTDSGLLRYDGHRFERFTRGPDVELPSNIITAVAAAPGGGLYVGTERPGGLAIVRSDGHATRLDRDGRLAEARVEHLVVTAGALWVGTDRGVHRFVDGELETIAGLADAAVTAMAADDDGRVWVATGAGLFGQALDARGRFERVGAPVDISALAIAPGGAVYVSVAGVGVQRVEAGAVWPLVVPGVSVRRRLSRYHSLAFDRKGRLWLGWWGGYAVVDTDEPGAFAQRFVNGLRVERILANPQGGVWVAHHWGVVHLVGEPIVRTVDEDAVVFAVAEDRDGRLWASYHDSLVRMEGGDKRRLRAGEALPFWCPRSLAAARAGGMWVGTCADGLWHIEGDEVASVVEPGSGRWRNARALLEDDEGRLWLGDGQGRLWELRDGALVGHSYGGPACPVPSSPEDEDCEHSVSALAQRRGGGLWIATLKGVYGYQPGLAADAKGEGTRLAGLPSDYALSLHQGSGGVLWIGTQGHGLIRWERGAVASVDVNAGLPAQSVHGITEDAAGDLWMSGERGIFRIGNEDLEAYFAGRVDRVHAFAYGLEDGLRSLVTMQAFSSTIKRLQDGEIAVATAKGLARVLPERAVDTSGFFEVVLESMMVAGQAVRPRRDLRFDLPLGQGTLGPTVFSFTAPNFRVAHRLRFEYRVRGEGEAWIEADARRTVNEPALPPGDYALEVRGFLEDVMWQPPKTLVRFTVVGFHQRPAFYGLLALAMLPLAGLVYIVRLRQARARFGVVLGERNRIARDLHDSLAQYFTGISYQLEQLDMLIGADDQAARAVNRETKEIVTRCRLESRHTIHDLRSENMEPPTLVDGLEDLVEQTSLYGSADVDLRVDGQEDRRMTPSVRQGLLRIAREATVNALAHAAAERILLHVIFSERAVTLRVDDDGRGFDPENPGDGSTLHHGLTGMKERASGFGGELSLQSEVGVGTRVEVRVVL